MIDTLPLIERTKWGKLVSWNERILLHVASAYPGLTKSENDQLVKWLGEKRQHSQVVNVWEDVLEDNPELLQFRLHALTGDFQRIHGRACQVHQVQEEDARLFFNRNHMQGYATAASYYGLQYQGEWVAMASFGQPRLMSRDYAHEHLSGELIRFCNRAGCRVYGGLGKLVQHYFLTHEVDDLMTYSDFDWSNGESFAKLGFQLKGNKPPMAFTIIDGKRSLCAFPEPNSHYLWNSGSFKWVLNRQG
jgi:hypothetical protein